MVSQSALLILLLCLISTSTSLRTGIARTRNSGRQTQETTEKPIPATAKSAQPHTFTVSVKGDFMIGVLFSIHHQPKHKRASNSISCGEIREMYGIQRTEATFFTLDRINSNAAILPNITLGVEIRDSCWYAPVALRQSIEFIRDAISLTGSKDKCAAEPNSQKTPLIGVIGPGSSSVALQVQNLLQLFQLPQIGYSTTSKDLSDKSRFSYFMRVVPSDYYQAQVIVDLVSAQNWTYVSAVNTDENYGQSGIQAFRELAERANVCIAKEDSVLSNAEDDAFERVLLNLERDPNARVVVCFCEGMTVRGLLGASRRLNLTGRFLFIGSDGWADRSDVVDGFEKEAQGSISIRIHSPYVKEFDEYYFGLNPFSNQRNPWFKEFWETKFNCSLPGSSTWKPGRANCTGEEQLRDRYKQEPKLSFVVKAIYTMAHGLHNMIQDVCGVRGFCKEIFPFNGSLFKSHLFNVTFPYGDGENEEIVEFDRKGDPPGRYDVMNFQKLPNGSYDYVHVGDWNNGTVTFQKQLQFTETVAEGRVESVCSKPCAPGFYRSFTGGQEQQCCWACVQCDQNEILVDLLTCEACSPGFWPNPNKTACVKIEIEFTQWTDSEAIVAIAFSVLGFVATIFAGAVFVKYNNTPVVKSSTRELSYLILAGMGLSHATTFPILAQPTTFTCILSRTLPGISFAMIYASLLIKTNRIARILAGSKKRFPTKNLRFMSATSQVLYLRKFQNLKSLNLSGNPMCNELNFQQFIHAYLPQLVYYEYRMISDSQRIEAKSTFGGDLQTLEEEEAAERTEKIQHQVKAEQEEMNKCAFVEYLGGNYFFESMFSDDPEGNCMLQMGDEIHDTYREYNKNFSAVSHEIQTCGLKYYTLRKEEITEYESTVDNAKMTTFTESRELLEEFLVVKKGMFAKVKQMLDTDEDNEDAMAQLSVKIQQINETFQDLCLKTWHTLMQKELYLFEAMEKVNTNLERNLTEQITEFTEAAQARFAQIRSLEEAYFEATVEIADRYYTRLTLMLAANKDSGEHLPPELLQIMVDRESLTNGLSASHDCHIRVIDRREDQLVNSAKAWLWEYLNQLNAAEFSRSRSQISEMNHFLDSQKQELQAMMATPMGLLMLPTEIQEALQIK